MLPIKLQDFDLVIFGGRGDLAQRKLFPSLFGLFIDGRLPSQWRLLPLGRSSITDADLHDEIRHALLRHGIDQEILTQQFDAFMAHVNYQALDGASAGDLLKLAKILASASRLKVFYLATRSDLYGDIARNLMAAGLNGADARIVLEKPIGKDMHSAMQVSQAVDACFKEDQIYRIDHYLGKETVQNLLVLRFANTIFETQWNQKYIDHVQITISETLGVGGRADFYDHVGALRDMGQNHLIQLLCMTAMEAPYQMQPDAVRDEKVKVLRALRCHQASNISDHVVFGQYRHGAIGGQSVMSYLDEPGVHPQSQTETFVAMKVEIDNWRWAGVPFYLRTGKRLCERACEIAVHFKSVPHAIFDVNMRSDLANRLVFRLQPDEGIRLSLAQKRAGAGMSVRNSELSLSPGLRPKQRIPDAYERLLFDVVAGNQTLFVREDEFMAAWAWMDPVLQYMTQSEVTPEGYNAGTWGPPSSTLLLARDGRLWDEFCGARPDQFQ